MTPSELDKWIYDLAKELQAGHMQRLGIGPTMRLALAYNSCKFAKQLAWRDNLYQSQFSQLLADNGDLTRPSMQMRDGWAIDTSLSLPHLDRVLADSDKIIAERRGVRLSERGAYRSYFQNIFTNEDVYEYPSFIEFATSSDVLSAVGHYLETIPALSTTLPTGIRLVESNAAFDDQPEYPKDSQLFHIDYYSLPNVYVLVLLRDTTINQGPWTFLPRGVSQQVREKLGYWQPECGYRLSDEDVYSIVDPSEVITFTYPRGTVLFIESSGCLHYGSRNSFEPRFQLMLGYTGACRTDFSEVLMPPSEYPVGESDSLLRQLVLDKRLCQPTETWLIDTGQLPSLLTTLSHSADEVNVDLDLPDRI